jgi:predicted  nucleic acid-binding Zn-ribbon protein
MKNDNQIKEDINGRIHSLDQASRSLEKRLRAVERRLSAGDAPEGSQYITDPEIEIDDIRERISAIRDRLDSLTGSDPGRSLVGELNVLRQQNLELGKRIDTLSEDNLKLHAILDKFSGPVMEEQGKAYEQLSAELRGGLASLGQRLDKAENRNRLNIGSVKVPLEISGIIGAIILALTGGLIIADRWDIIRSPLFSFGIALTLGMAVLMKSYLANRSKT